MIRKALLIAFLAACAAPASMLAGRESSEASRDGIDQLLQAAEKARDDNRVDDAIRLFRRILSEQPESEQALWYLGTLLHEKERYAEAREVLRQFVTIRPDAGPAWALLGLGEFQLREYPRALDHLQRGMALGMGDRKELVQAVFYDVVILLTRAERFDDSMDMLLKMLASGPRDPALIVPAGLAGLRLPFLPMELPPDRREMVSLAGQAVLAVQTQQYEEAESEFRRLMSAYPNEPGVHFLYGAYLVQLHPNDSVPEFERELEISPSHVLARIRLAEHLIAQRDFDRALALARQAIKLDPGRARLCWPLATPAMVSRNWKPRAKTTPALPEPIGICFGLMPRRGARKTRSGRSARSKRSTAPNRRVVPVTPPAPRATRMRPDDPRWHSDFERARLLSCR